MNPAVRLRPATADDVRAYVGQDIAAAWCIEGRVVGYAAERDGELIALGVVSWDRYGRAWGWFSWRERLSAVRIHRGALEMLRLLRQVGEPVLYVICNMSIPGSDTWLRRLGFAATGETVARLGPVWRLNL